METNMLFGGTRKCSGFSALDQHQNNFPFFLLTQPKKRLEYSVYDLCIQRNSNVGLKPDVKAALGRFGPLKDSGRRKRKEWCDMRQRWRQWGNRAILLARPRVNKQTHSFKTFPV
ncbi:hypothetical protein ATANTOWER_017631 [Ataeniobius toweri]|uniref:Uncharacterized protein n=1 Tax=Ataeniobius toweri TaxID=208326 RepID=A0ABU7A2C9_9TELE|nr:hypothetical protein [Ataeniobius toweri]